MVEQRPQTEVKEIFSDGCINTAQREEEDILFTTKGGRGECIPHLTAAVLLINSSYTPTPQKGSIGVQLKKELL